MHRTVGTASPAGAEESVRGAAVVVAESGRQEGLIGLGGAKRSS